LSPNTPVAFVAMPLHHHELVLILRADSWLGHVTTRGYSFMHPFP
jgi:hypothetical protein